MANCENSSRVRYRGKFLTKKQYELKMTAKELGKANQGRRVRTEMELNNVPQPHKLINVDNRIVNLSMLGKELICSTCEAILSLNNIVNETKRGLGSYLEVACTQCPFVKTVPTSKLVKEPDSKNRQSFEINYKVSIGCLHGGIGNQVLNKVLGAAGIPTMNYNTNKDYERRVGPVVERIAKESCDRAAKIERELTIKNVEEIEKTV
ncbi:uncharacterized protein [Fopius arisanus]|uniref:CbpM protein n=1 Tax=Fopius arisanus TaxID=64838 RepID=A0A0C9RPL5_9HYME|nr:PREDICTED: uncharacterized protein LOC105272402 [Fopius arisanus]